MTEDLLIINGTVITANTDFDILPNAMVAVRHGKISRVGPMPAAGPLPPAVEELDAAGHIVMPGLVNAHTHLPMVLFRGMADDLPLQEWLHAHMFPAESRWITPDTVGPAARLACAEMLLSGTTTCCDGYFLEHLVAEAVQEAGLRAVLAQGVIDFPAPGVPDPAANVSTAEAFVAKWAGTSALIRPSIFCHSPYTCSGDTIRRAKAAADAAGVLFQIHVAETDQERRDCIEEHGLSPVAYLDRLGVLDARTLCVHAVWVDAADERILGDRGVGIAHCPRSNMKLASGTAPVPSFLDARMPVGLGTDGAASNNTLDMLAEMTTAARLHKSAGMAPTAATARQMIEAATIGGAAAIGLDEVIGSIAPGKAADLVIVDTRAPHMTPMYQPVSHVVYAARASDVRNVMVNGRWVVRNRRMLTMDVKTLMADVNAIASAIAEDRR
jgi:5-methylthioadenosine/S-adenosylhomocysteine deaminase